MLLICKAVDHQGHLRDYACQVSLLEDGLAFMSRIVASGERILYIHLVEDGKRTVLPAGAFDGEPMVRPIKALQQQWQAILTPLPRRLLPSQWLIEAVLTLIDGCEVRMALYNEAIVQLEGLKTIAQTIVRDPVVTNRLVSRYQQQISFYLKYLILAQTGRDAGLRRLAQLQTHR